jgi:hypothetical protein
MAKTEEHQSERGQDWEEIGRAAERLARRVARDASKFAERIQEHAGDFANEVSCGWQHRHRVRERSCRSGKTADVRPIFEDVRGVLSDIVDGIDEFISNAFRDRPGAAPRTWVRVVSDRDTTCGRCGRSIAAGQAVYAGKAEGGELFRCVECGAPRKDGPRRTRKSGKSG